MRVTRLDYAADGWGVGELWLDGSRLVEHSHPSPARRVENADAAHPLADRFRAYFAGARDDFADVELDVDEGTPLEGALLDAIRSVPYGEVVTYGELAALAGHPNAQRAAGTFCAQNRLPLLLPCHRVVAAGGIGSYGTLGGEYKRRLLELEHVVL
jgi:methylated-DNA-[protein]-cysteine S-methyltransferase